MSRRRKKERVFIALTINSLGALVGIVGLMFLSAKIFGELAIPAISTVTVLLCIPMVTMVIGILGWIFSRNSNY